jgi:cytochrome b561
MTSDAPQSYSGAMRAFHWATVILLTFVYVIAFSIENASSGEQARLLLTLHRTAGGTVLVLTLGRLLWRMRSAIPSLPSDLPRWQVFAAHANAAGLYGLLLGQPLLGLCASWLHGDKLVFYGLPVPSPLPIDRPLSRQLFELHHLVGYLLLAMIAVHVGAALFHHFVRRDTVLLGMIRGESTIDDGSTVKTRG